MCHCKSALFGNSSHKNGKDSASRILRLAMVATRRAGETGACQKEKFVASARRRPARAPPTARATRAPRCRPSWLYASRCSHSLLNQRARVVARVPAIASRVDRSSAVPPTSAGQCVSASKSILSVSLDSTRTRRGRRCSSGFIRRRLHHAAQTRRGPSPRSMSCPRSRRASVSIPRNWQHTATCESDIRQSCLPGPSNR